MFEGDWEAAAYYGELHKIKAMKSAGANVNYKTRRTHFTALILAAQEGHEDVVKYLLANGADVNHKTREGMTALYTASKRGHRVIVNLLLANGAEYGEDKVRRYLIYVHPRQYHIR